MNPSQEPARPGQPGPPPTDPTADPGAFRAPDPSPGPVPGPDEEAGRAARGGEFGAPGGGAGFGLAHPSGPQYTPAGWGPLRSVRRPWRRTLLVSVLTALVIFVLGGPLGLLWAWVAPGVPVIDSGPGGIVVNDPSPEEYIAADGWFTMLGVCFGLVVAIVAWIVLRRDRGPFLLLGVVAGTLGAGYLAAPWIGEMIGRDAYQQWKEAVTQGATYLAPPEVHSLGPMLVPGFVAAVVLTLLAGWSNDPDLERPGARPGYGPNSEAGWAPGSPPSSSTPGLPEMPGSPEIPGSPEMPGSAGMPGYGPDGEASESHAGVGYRPDGAHPATPGPFEPPHA